MWVAVGCHQVCLCTAPLNNNLINGCHKIVRCNTYKCASHWYVTHCFLQKEAGRFWGSIDNSGNTGVRSKQEQAESWNGRWKIYVDPIDSRSAVSLVGRLRLQSAMLWSTSQRISVSGDSTGSLNLTLKWIIFIRCCSCSLNRPEWWDWGASES